MTVFLGYSSIFAENKTTASKMLLLCIWNKIMAFHNDAANLDWDNVSAELWYQG